MLKDTCNATFVPAQSDTLVTIGTPEQIASLQMYGRTKPAHKIFSGTFHVPLQTAVFLCKVAVDLAQ